MSPVLAGYLLTLSTLGWPLLIGGLIKAIYDVALLIKFRGGTGCRGALRTMNRGCGKRWDVVLLRTATGSGPKERER